MTVTMTMTKNKIQNQSVRHAPARSLMIYSFLQPFSSVTVKYSHHKCIELF